MVDAEVNKERGRPLFGVNGVVRSKKVDRADIVRDVRYDVLPMSQAAQESATYKMRESIERLVQGQEVDGSNPFAPIVYFPS